MVLARLFAAVCAMMLATGVAAQADPNKHLRVAFRAAETGFDPQAISDIYSGYVVRAVFDGVDAAGAAAVLVAHRSQGQAGLLKDSGDQLGGEGIQTGLDMAADELGVIEGFGRHRGGFIRKARFSMR